LQFIDEVSTVVPDSSKTRAEDIILKPRHHDKNKGVKRAPGPNRQSHHEPVDKHVKGMSKLLNLLRSQWQRRSWANEGGTYWSQRRAKGGQ